MKLLPKMGRIKKLAGRPSIILSWPFCPACRDRDQTNKNFAGARPKQGVHIPVIKLCSWLGIPRRSFYYQPRPRSRKMDEPLAEQIRQTIQEFPTYGYHRLAFLLQRNRKAVQRILQVKGCKFARGHREKDSEYGPNGLAVMKEISVGPPTCP